MVYYEFNRTGKGGKYKKMSVEEYEQAKLDPKRWFLEGWDEDGKVLLYVMECSKDMYDEVQSEKNHSAYIGRDRSNRKAVVLSLESDLIECSMELSIFYDGASSSVADVVMEKLSRSHTREQIHKALSILSDSEKDLLYQISVCKKKQSEVARELGLDRSTINKKYHNLLQKLKAYLDKLNQID